FFNQPTNNLSLFSPYLHLLPTFTSDRNLTSTETMTLETNTNKLASQWYTQVTLSIQTITSSFFNLLLEKLIYYNILIAIFLHIFQNSTFRFLFKILYKILRIRIERY